MKTCECGCGAITPLAKYTNKRDGTIKGESVRFVKNHHSRTPRPLFRKGYLDGQEVLLVPLDEEREAIIDPEDWPLLMGHSWYFDEGYARSQIGKMHRVILGTPADLLTDHKNRNRLDNRKKNLRTATRLQNCCNRTCTSKSGFKGVTKNRGKWMAQIAINGVNYHLGRFYSPEEAHAAYRDAAPRFHGEFASV